jgi:hypothetical protein
LSSTWFRVNEHNKRLGSRWGCYLEWHWALLFLCGQKRPLKISVTLSQFHYSISRAEKCQNWLSFLYVFQLGLMCNFSFRGLAESHVEVFPTLIVHHSRHVQN